MIHAIKDRHGDYLCQSGAQRWTTKSVKELHVVLNSDKEYMQRSAAQHGSGCSVVIFDRKAVFS